MAKTWTTDGLTVREVDSSNALRSAAVGALKGPLHGGAGEAVMRTLEEIGQPDNADAFTRQALAEKRRLMGIQGEPPDLMRPPHGCRFAARCPFRIPACTAAPIPELVVSGSHRVRCIRATEAWPPLHAVPEAAISSAAARV